jgi:formylglycine-generating enzyme required for sulfatase activity
MGNAARGTTGTVFPWGDQKTAAKCNVRETGVGTTTSVSRYHSGVSQYGVYGRFAVGRGELLMQGLVALR